MPQFQLKYTQGKDGKQHILPDQAFTGIKATGGKVVYIQLAGNRKNGEKNNFAMKHLLTPSKKGTKAEDKMLNRVHHRFDKGGTKGYSDPKKMGAGVLGRKAKYGGLSPDMNTVVDLNDIDFDTCLVTMAKALLAHDWGKNAAAGELVRIDFGKPVVKSIGIAEKLSAKNHMTVKAAQTSPACFEVFHYHAD